jgi:hypothetical protein
MKSDPDRHRFDADPQHWPAPSKWLLMTFALVFSPEFLYG